ncbi:Glucosidase II beta subunit-like family protein [Candida parapsilosis]|uniref:Glucosidase 2 subunit beta n=2 Tax=Candida parapsilosis TaxID=5480 RepID=G8BC35_CANPC|nr:uncharacterized protein CPAR2_802500 [Candida parapsilosis]KAF6051599.1 Glucosidase II beta subunit-like family protein [Candida parapsilosis]KAF6052904.1 Glucosidase II beta subunit-like family protein [Candida parapsilosis]KAF6053401.1 Glucosidase II beta subunit-like family protein [Candida parapsilosis]KAF6064682.1 Glucosidase II beta subunit-like family protein [Candida parapsilosis]CAD1810617.1 unnamed protein product [Candida parapsilosis]
MLQLFIVSTVLSLLANANIIGVSDERQALYQPIIGENGEKYWHCLNDTSIRLSYDQINDDVCDCPDGSDEPGTNACPNPPFKFYCRNEGHFPNYIDQFKLNDGVCDYDLCCDGSDEYKLGGCENKCKEIHRQLEEYKHNKLSFLKKASVKKERTIKIAHEKRLKLIENLRKLEQKVPELRSKCNSLKLQSENLDDADESVFDHLQDYFGGLADKVKLHKRDILHQESKLQALETILNFLSTHYNPNFNDAAVKEVIQKFQEYISNKEEEALEDIHETNQIIHQLVEKAKTMSHSGVEKVSHFTPSIPNMIRYYYQLFTSKFLPKPVVEYKSDLSSNELDHEVEKLEQELEKLQTRIQIIKDNLSADFGPDDILRAYDQLTLSKDLGGYNYRINLIQGISQDDIFIGKFKEYKDGKIYYHKGARCWNGPKRSATVEFICGEGPDLVSVSEPEKCHYFFTIQGESWCNSKTEKDLLDDFKINYDLL